MSRQEITLAKVVEMIDLGMTGPEIATAFGVDARQLRAVCATHGIKLSDNSRAFMRVKVPDTVNATLRKEAGARGLRAHDLAARVLEIVAVDNLFTAVLDR